MKSTEKVTGENIHENVKAVVYSHSHLDQYGGAEAFISKEKFGKILVISPCDYEQSLVDDNLYDCDESSSSVSRRYVHRKG